MQSPLPEGHEGYRLLPWKRPLGHRSSRYRLPNQAMLGLSWRMRRWVSWELPPSVKQHDTPKHIMGFPIRCLPTFSGTLNDGCAHSQCRHLSMGHSVGVEVKGTCQSKQILWLSCSECASSDSHVALVIRWEIGE